MNNQNDTLIKVKEVLLLVAKKINSLGINWLLGGSGGLMVNRVEIIPHDLDFFVTRDGFDLLADKFSEYLVGKINLFNKAGKPIRNFKIVIKGIEVEFYELKIKKSDLKTIDFNGEKIPVNPLEVELSYYKKRPGKEETVRLIEKKLISI